MKPLFESKHCTLYHGDAKDLLLSGAVTKPFRVISDPPYGLDFQGKGAGRHVAKNWIVKEPVETYEDTVESWMRTVQPVIISCVERYESSAFVMADVRLSDMPRGFHLGGIFSPSGTGLTAWGFQCFMHVCFYGKCPYQPKGARPNGKYGLWGNDANKVAHPCAKPIEAMRWLVGRASLEGETVFDPFTGSGTMAVACVELGRNFVGCEIDPDYCKVAIERIERAEADARSRLPFSRSGNQPEIGT